MFIQVIAVGSVILFPSGRFVCRHLKLNRWSLFILNLQYLVCVCRLIVNVLSVVFFMTIIFLLACLSVSLAFCNTLTSMLQSCEKGLKVAQPSIHLLSLKCGKQGGFHGEGKPPFIMLDYELSFDANILGKLLATLASP